MSQSLSSNRRFISCSIEKELNTHLKQNKHTFTALGFFFFCNPCFTEMYRSINVQLQVTAQYCKQKQQTNKHKHTYTKIMISRLEGN
jgi:hypothetical protein